MAERAFSAASELRASPEAVWEHATDPAGVNRELRPLLRMTFPKTGESLVEIWKPGERLFRSWILLGGVLPVEYDDVTIMELEPGRRFLERSPMLSQKLWQHERIVEPVAGGCRITDRLRFVPRIPALGSIYGFFFRLVFRLRHRNLRRAFGSIPS